VGLKLAKNSQSPSQGRKKSPHHTAKPVGVVSMSLLKIIDHETN